MEGYGSCWNIRNITPTPGVTALEDIETLSPRYHHIDCLYPKLENLKNSQKGVPPHLRVRNCIHV